MLLKAYCKENPILFSSSDLSKLMFPDHHLHSRYSRCSHGTHDLIDIYHKLKLLNKPYVCISDHIHYDFDDQYFPNHLKVRDDLKKTELPIPLYLGAEVTIIDRSGRIAKADKSFGHLDYFMIGEHYLPGSPITMDRISESRNTLLEWMKNDFSNLKKMFDIYQEMYIGGIQQHKPLCIVHPFSTILRCDFAHIQLYDILEKVCEVCQTTQTAIELNESQIQSCYVSPTLQLMDHPDIPSKKEFYGELIKISKKYDIKYSTGSDGHLIEDIGFFSGVENIIDKFQIKPEKIVDLGK